LSFLHLLSSMKNPIQLTINVALLLAVAVLYYLHFSRGVAAPARAHRARRDLLR